MQSAKLSVKIFFYLKLLQETEEDLCSNIKNPLSKNQCNDILLLNSQCCFTETIYETKVTKECIEFSRDTLEFEEDMKNYIKFYLIVEKITEEDKITDDTLIISQLNLEIPKMKKISCNSNIKSIDYSKKKITKKDLNIARDNKFCSTISDNINIENCLNGLLFDDFIKDGGKCCYLEIKQIVINKKREIQCIPLSKISRINKFFINVIIEQNKPSEEFEALLVCDDIKSKYNSNTNYWTNIGDN